MQKSITKSFIVGILVLLAGCQTNTEPNTFHIKPPLFFSPSASAQANLAQTVQDALVRADPALNQLHVEANQKTVILSGYVKKIRQSDLAEQVAAQVAGPQNVQNHIIVKP